MDCPICLEPIDPAVRVGDGVGLLTTCGHSFHQGCLLGAFQQTQSCPFCRRPVDRLSENPDKVDEAEARRVIGLHLQNQRIWSRYSTTSLKVPVGGTIVVPGVPVPVVGGMANVGYRDAGGRGQSRGIGSGGLSRMYSNYRQNVEVDPRLMLLGLCVFFMAFLLLRNPDVADYLRRQGDPNTRDDNDAFFP